MSVTGNGSALRRRILIADDEALVLYTAKAIVEKDCEVVGKAMDGAAQGCAIAGAYTSITAGPSTVQAGSSEAKDASIARAP